jgi:hypothetical protein
MTQGLFGLLGMLAVAVALGRCAIRLVQLGTVLAACLGGVLIAHLVEQQGH